MNRRSFIRRLGAGVVALAGIKSLQGTQDNPEGVKEDDVIVLTNGSTIRFKGGNSSDKIELSNIDWLSFGDIGKINQYEFNKEFIKRLNT